ncbi:MAG: dihydroorotate dehydrogenase electron transfer subunit [Candidatus Bilamarchaeaceae archaeon]
MKDNVITAKINEVEKENDNITSYSIDYKIRAKPGQFIMIWLPQVGERPMGIAKDDPLTITVAHVGEVTNEIKKLKKGDLISFRGPFGNGFTKPEKSENILLIGGGTGVVPLYFLAQKTECKSIKFVFGARSKNNLFYEKKLREVVDELIITTDDGSEGIKGNVLAAMEKIDLKKIDRIYTCGPEKMMAAVIRKADEFGIEAEASLERYMKCGLGICGSCMFGPYRVCADGPIFDKKTLLKIPDFGSYKRDATGRKISI